ncbi:hypothetical protein HAX54_041942, partial [Datura stramonium]|nr:hypothetical protein [Datura stramonium]
LSGEEKREEGDLDVATGKGEVGGAVEVALVGEELTGRGEECAAVFGRRGEGCCLAFGGAGVVVRLVVGINGGVGVVFGDLAGGCWWGLVTARFIGEDKEEEAGEGCSGGNGE